VPPVSIAPAAQASLPSEENQPGNDLLCKLASTLMQFPVSCLPDVEAKYDFASVVQGSNFFVRDGELVLDPHKTPFAKFPEGGAVDPGHEAINQCSLNLEKAAECRAWVEENLSTEKAREWLLQRLLALAGPERCGQLMLEQVANFEADLADGTSQLIFKAFKSGKSAAAYIFENVTKPRRQRIFKQMQSRLPPDVLACGRELVFVDGGPTPRSMVVATSVEPVNLLYRLLEFAKTGELANEQRKGLLCWLNFARATYSCKEIRLLDKAISLVSRGDKDPEKILVRAFQPLLRELEKSKPLDQGKKKMFSDIHTLSPGLIRALRGCECVGWNPCVAEGGELQLFVVPGKSEAVLLHLEGAGFDRDWFRTSDQKESVNMEFHYLDRPKPGHAILSHHVDTSEMQIPPSAGSMERGTITAVIHKSSDPEFLLTCAHTVVPNYALSKPLKTFTGTGLRFVPPMEDFVFLPINGLCKGMEILWQCFNKASFVGHELLQLLKRYESLLSEDRKSLYTPSTLQSISQSIVQAKQALEKIKPPDAEKWEVAWRFVSGREKHADNMMSAFRLDFEKVKLFDEDPEKFWDILGRGYHDCWLNTKKFIDSLNEINVALGMKFSPAPLPKSFSRTWTLSNFAKLTVMKVGATTGLTYGDATITPVSPNTPNREDARSASDSYEDSDENGASIYYELRFSSPTFKFGEAGDSGALVWATRGGTRGENSLSWVDFEEPIPFGIYCGKATDHHRCCSLREAIHQLSKEGEHCLKCLSVNEVMDPSLWDSRHFCEDHREDYEWIDFN
jgi:hypothetical protein